MRFTLHYGHEIVGKFDSLKKFSILSNQENSNIKFVKTIFKLLQYLSANIWNTYQLHLYEATHNPDIRCLQFYLWLFWPITTSAEAVLCNSSTSFACNIHVTFPTSII